MSSLFLTVLPWLFHISPPFCCRPRHQQRQTNTLIVDDINKNIFVLSWTLIIYFVTNSSISFGSQADQPTRHAFVLCVMDASWSVIRAHGPSCFVHILGKLLFELLKVLCVVCKVCCCGWYHFGFLTAVWLRETLIFAVLYVVVLFRSTILQYFDLHQVMNHVLLILLLSCSSL